MNNNNLISIIVPAYNIAPYISRCLDSILLQTYQNIEIIVVNDGSTDKTAAIINRYATIDKRIKPIHQKNGGVVKARFVGVCAAKGDWIGFVDGDDYIAPDMYQHLLNNAVTYNADISHCGYRMVFPDRTNYYYNTGCIIEQDNIRGIKDLLQGQQIEPGLWNKLYRKKLFQNIPQDKINGIRINEDLLINYYLFKVAQKSVYEDFCPYHYMVRKGSAITSKVAQYHFTDPEKVTEIIFDDTKSQNELHNISLGIYIDRLRNSAVQREYHIIANSAKQKLRDFHKKNQLSFISRKYRYITLLIAYCMPLYRLIRWVYNKLTRIDHKYDI